MIKQYCEHLGLKYLRQEGNEFIHECPWCDSKKFSVNSQTGAWRCFRCDNQGFPYQLAKKLTTLDGKGIFELLARFGLGQDSPAAARTQTQPPKELMIKAEDIVDLPLLDQLVFCDAKGMDRTALLALRPKRHRVKPWVLLPAYNPDDMRTPCGWIRAGIDGQPIITKAKNDDGEWVETAHKYANVAGSKPGLVGVSSIAHDNPDVVVFAEGWKDAVAAIAMGYAAVANSHGAKVWHDSWSKLLKDKIVYIVYDRDDAGVHGAEKLASHLDGSAKEIYVVELPYEITEKNGKDLHDFYAEGGNLQALMDNTLLWQKTDTTPTEQAVEDGVVDQSGIIVLSDDHPDTIASAFEAWSVKECNVKHRYNSIDGWSLYSNNKYQKIDDDKELEVYLRHFLQICKFKTRVKQPDGGFKTFNMGPDKKHKSPAYINSIMKWLRDITDVHLRPSQKAPCSLDNSLNPENVIATKNCLLDIETGKTCPVSDKYYTFNYLPYDYHPDSISDKWGNFLADITDNDIEIMILLQQWCGYLLMPTNKYQKFLLCVGDGANGKFVFFDTISAALGKNNVSNVPLACFSEPYKIFSTYGKAVNMSNENAKNLEANAESVIKEYVGGDKMLWEQKYKDAFSAYPTAKLMFATNILPVIRDTSDGIWRRMIYVPFDVSIPVDKQNKNLAKELQEPGELAGILNWMLEGRQMLIEKDGFITPKRCQEKLNQYRDESNSARLFITENLEVAPKLDAYITKSDLYSHYQKWCQNNGYHAKGNVQFGTEVKRCFTVAKDTRPWINGQRKTCYLGIQYQDGIEIGQGNDDYTGYGHGGTLYN